MLPEIIIAKKIQEEFEIKDDTRLFKVIIDALDLVDKKDSREDKIIKAFKYLGPWVIAWFFFSIYLFFYWVRGH